MLSRSIPDIPLVIRNLIPLQHSPEFILKCVAPMMLFLVVDIPPDYRDLRIADGKRAIARLPRKRL
jgi:hypothetical protein